jgi:hypothetical protein
MERIVKTRIKKGLAWFLIFAFTYLAMPSPWLAKAYAAVGSITTVSPTTGSVGSNITITGTNFGALNGDSRVYVGAGVQTTFTSWTNTRIICRVPDGATSSGLYVHNTDGDSNVKTFNILAPSISSISPTAGKISSQVTIFGTNFGEVGGPGTGVQPSSSMVYFYSTGYPATPYISWSSTRIICTVPSGISGNVQVRVRYGDDNKESNSKIFSVALTSIYSISPSVGVVGDTVTITGTNFGSAPHLVRFYDEKTATVDEGSSTDTIIVCTVPEDAASGQVYAGSSACSPKGNFTIAPPSILTVSPSSAQIGVEAVTITGTNFGKSRGSSQVIFYNNKPATSYESWNNTQIVCYVPSGAQTGNLFVHTSGGDSNTHYFAVLGITGFAPANGQVGDPVTITGIGFGTGTAGSAVTIAGGAITSPSSNIVSWNDTQVVARVPASAQTKLAHIYIYNAATGRSFDSGTDLGNFEVLTPSDVAASPNHGGAGDSITITGQYFGDYEGTPSGMGVYFGGVKATVSAANWTRTQIVCPVPAGAVTGNVEVKTAGGTAGVAFVVNPQLISLTPNSGVAGDTITIAGTGFGSPQGDSTLTFNGAAAIDIDSWDNTEIVVKVPNTGSTGPVVVTRVYSGISAPSNSLTFTYNTPTLTALDPNYGRSGDTVTLTGTNFGATRGSSTVTFNGVAVADPAGYLYWDNTSIEVSVPAAGNTGDVVVHTGGGDSNGKLFTYQPFISSIAPTEGVNGDRVTINGDHFGATRDTSTVAFNDIPVVAPAGYLSWSDTQIEVLAPPEVQTGPVKVTVNDAPSNLDVIFTVTAPNIDNIDPQHGAIGSAVTINGTRFGAQQNGSSVTFNGVDAGTATSWSDTQVVINVPSGAETGEVQITTQGGSSTYSVFTVDPIVSSLNPNHGVVGTLVTVTGEHFMDTQGTSTITFNGVDASGNVQSWSMTEIVVTAPVDVTSGPVVVQVNGYDSNDTVSFTVDAPNLDGAPPLEPNFGLSGDTITLNGHNFGEQQGSTGHVYFNGTEAPVNSWSDTQIEVQAPDSETGAVVVETGGGSSTENPIFTYAPEIQGFDPDPLASGYRVTLTGRHFGDGTDSRVTFNGTDAAGYDSWTDTEIIAIAPQDVTSGEAQVHVPLGSSNTNNYTVAQPQLDDIYPYNGEAGDQVTLYGQYFGEPQGGSVVHFNGAAATTYVSWSDTEVVVEVPEGAQTGDLYLSTVGGGDSDPVTFTYNPHITSLSPSHGDRGMGITINGDHFTDDPGTFFGMITFNDGSLDSGGWSSWSDTQIILNVPDGALTGNVNVSLNVVSSNGELFTLDAPAITNITPSDGVVGETITIEGQYFGANFGALPPADALVTFFEGIQATDYISWDSTQIVLNIPPDAQTGDLTVTTAGGTSSGFNFTIRPPQINGSPQLDPDHGPAGATITINGTDFGASQGSIGWVQFNGVDAAVQTWDNTQIVVTAPDADTGAVVVHTGGGNSTEDPTFTYDPIITGLSPDPLASGYEVTIEGQHFGDGTNSTVTFNGTEAASYVSWNDTQIIAIAPQDVTSGDAVVHTSGDSNGWGYSVAQPELQSIDPTNGVAGNQITLHGAYFGSTQGGSSVHFTNADVTNYISWGDTQVVVEVPEGALTGEVTLETVGGGASVGQLFTYIPHIDNLDPDTADWGAEITINGDHFTNDPGSYGGTVIFFDGVPATYTSWDDTQIVVNVPVGTQTGDVYVTLNSVDSNAVTFTVASPHTDAIEPTDGVVGETVTITGSNFGSEQGSSYVTFYDNIQATDYPSWNNTEIQVVIPPDARNGDVGCPVTVTTAGGTSGSLVFTIRTPQISELDPDNGFSGDTVTINGTNFGASQGAIGWVQFDGVPATVTEWTNEYIVVTAPDSHTGSVVVHTGGGDSTEDPIFTYLPVIANINPDHGQYGDVFTLTGANFGEQGSEGRVYFGPGTEANITSWNDTEIVGEVPEGGGETPVYVHTDAGYDSDAVNFTYYEPQISTIDPTHGFMNDTVTIHGQYFGIDQGGDGHVYFNGVEASVDSWNSTEIVVTVPDSDTGPLYVHNMAGDSNEVTFTYDPVIDNLNPANGVNGDEVTINGSHFGDSQNGNTVTFNGVDAGTASAWDNTHIVIAVPVDAGSGDVVVTVNGIPSGRLRLYH